MVTLHFSLSWCGAVNWDISSFHRLVSAFRQHSCMSSLQAVTCLWKTPLSLSSLCARCWYSCSSISPSPSHFGLRRFITQCRWQQQREGFTWVLSLTSDVPKPFSRISASSDFVLETFSKESSALIAIDLIKVMSPSGTWADPQVRIPSCYWRLHEITSCDLCDHLCSQSWSLNVNVVSIFCLHRERRRIRFHRPPE